MSVRPARRAEDWSARNQPSRGRSSRGRSSRGRSSQDQPGQDQQSQDRPGPGQPGPGQHSPGQHSPGQHSPDRAGQAGSRPPSAVVRAAGALPPGPALAALLAGVPLGALADRDVLLLAAGFRRLACWAQAGELAMAAEIAARAAAADPQIGLLADGRPARLPAAAVVQVAAALAMTRREAVRWTELAVALRWRLAATGRALAAGQIDLTRARLIAAATSQLTDEAAAEVQSRALPAARRASAGPLRAELAQAASVGLRAAGDGTAVLAGRQLPAFLATAAYDRITGLAKTAAAGGSLDARRAQVMLELLLAAPARRPG
ncbi:MAG: DUF222 domain-containing protein [Streptosporangiaceae bacterium]